MKIAWVTLYLFNLTGGEPVMVAQYGNYPNSAMEQCQATLAQQDKTQNWWRMVCIPVYKPE